MSDGWRDIETAPKDGREILLVGRWSDGRVVMKVWSWAGGSRAKWPYVGDFKPRYWHPLPEPPVTL